MNEKIIILLTLILFSLFVVMLVSLNLIDITGIYVRLVKYKGLMEFNNYEIEFINPTSHSYWPIYYNEEYYWTWFIVKSNKELDTVNLITSFPIVSPPQTVQIGFDGKYYYYRVIIKTIKEPNFIEWVELEPKSRISGVNNIILFPQVEKVIGTGGVEIIAVVVKDMDVLPSLISFQLYRQLIHQYERGIFIVFQNTGDDLIYEGSIVTINGVEFTPDRVVSDNGEDIQKGDIIKSGETFTAVIIGIPPTSIDEVKATINSDKGEVTTNNVNVLVGDEITTLSNSPSFEETPIPVSLPPTLYINYDPSDPNTHTSDVPGTFGTATPGSLIIPLNSYNMLSDTSGLDAGIVIMSNDGTHKYKICVGGQGEDVFLDVAKTRDGGYIAVGYTTSYAVGDKNGWVVKFDAKGNIEWVRVLGFQYTDMFVSVQQTEDGRYIIGGSYKTHPTANIWFGWVVKLDEQGDIIWSKRLGASPVYTGRITKLIETSTGDFVAVGYMIGGGSDDAVIFKLDSNGNCVWMKYWGWVKGDGLFDVIEDSDGNYVVVGKMDYDYGNKFGYGVLVKFSPNGNKLLSRRILSGGASGLTDTINRIVQLENGNYLVVGSYRTDYDTPDGKQLFVIEMTPSGSVVHKAVVSSSIHPQPAFVLVTTGDVLIGYKGTITTDSGTIVKTGLLRWSEIKERNLPGFTIHDTLYDFTIYPSIYTPSVSVNSLCKDNSPVIGYWNPQYVKVPSLSISEP